ncbi:hypothetical protein RF11_08958 [Thelohanellus kitauei]|uniref:Cullin family profile domain-containing protein n=1 Tax=Thelohanellus kitauei TaxID=669202 RepID=A0A0C2J113_THEKT|nr:hypothetical protein RF11_08958 [Thelohanellus kitauei]
MLMRSFASSIHQCEGAESESIDSRLFKIIVEHTKLMMEQIITTSIDEDFDQYLTQSVTCLDHVFIIVPNIIEEQHSHFQEAREFLAKLIIGDHTPALVQKFTQSLKQNDNPSMIIMSIVCDKILKISCDHSSLFEQVSKEFFEFVVKEIKKTFDDYIEKPNKLCDILSSKYARFENFIDKYAKINDELNLKLQSALKMVVEDVEENMQFVFTFTKYWEQLVFSAQPLGIDVSHKHMNIISRIYSQFTHREKFHRVMIHHMCRKIVYHHPENPNIEMFRPLSQYLTDDFFIYLNSLIADYTSSREIENQHKQKNPSQLSCKLTVARERLWPFNVSDCGSYYPEELAQYLESFSEFYRDRFKCRKLQYAHDESNGIIKYTINSVEYFFELNGCQLSLLNLLLTGQKTEQ